jgi:hypothetical protein
MGLAACNSWSEKIWEGRRCVFSWAGMFCKVDKEGVGRQAGGQARYTLGSAACNSCLPNLEGRRCVFSRAQMLCRIGRESDG